MEMPDINMEDLGLHGDKDLVNEVDIIKERDESQIATRIVRIDSTYYKYKYYKPSDKGLPVTANYTLLYEVKRDDSKSLGFKTIEDY